LTGRNTFMASKRIKVAMLQLNKRAASRRGTKSGGGADW
jgi:hypothetical protein